MKNLFTQKVLTIVSRIPKGKTLTYKEVATKAGSPGASRAVGSIMKANYRDDVPCHRVIRSDGNVGQYNRGGPSEKYKKLRNEGTLK